MQLRFLFGGSSGVVLARWVFKTPTLDLGLAFWASSTIYLKTFLSKASGPERKT